MRLIRSKRCVSISGLLSVPSVVVAAPAKAKSNGAALETPAIAKQNAVDDSYIVRLSELPVVAYDGNIGVIARSPDFLPLLEQQLTAERVKEFLSHLDELHYGYVEETDNPAYRMFLGA